jgi:hypothetical protein
MLLQHATTVINIYLSKWIDTGDRLIDNTVISLSALFITTLLYYISNNWKYMYNILVFYVFKMYKNPLAQNTLYIEPTFKNLEEFNTYTACGPSYITEDVVFNVIKSKGITKFTINDVNVLAISTIITNYLSTHNLMPLRNVTNNDIKSNITDELIFPIGVSHRGHHVYISPRVYSCALFSHSSKSIHYIKKFIEEYIANEIIRIYLNVERTNEIRVPNLEGKREFKLIGTVNKKKTFDTLFYPQKEELMAILKRFNEGHMYPEHIPMDNKLGILLYGPPGTGKTGTISAIANMLKRNVLVVNFTEVRTCSQLDQILDPSLYSRYIYVFDEFDCILDVISGSTPKEKEDTTDWRNMLLCAEGDERKAILEMMKQGRMKKDSSLDLAYLLQKLDGLESADNRIIIATTNNPERINPALLRPGRFDIKICLGLCTSSMVVDILANYYRCSREEIEEANIPGNKYSPLQLINTALQAPSMKQLLEQLTSEP